MENTQDFKELDIPKTLKFMVGSEGTADYLILGHKDHFNVGLRPLYDPAGPLVGFRVRVAWGDEEIVPMNVPEIIKTTFPAMPFSRISTKHGSVTGGIWLKGEQPNGPEIFNWLTETKFINNTLDSIREMAGITLEHREDVLSLLTQAYGNMLSVPVIGKTDPKEVQSKPKADVVAFPTKKATDKLGADNDTSDDDGGAI